jgi:uncharacterized membrane protein YbaN (DUF454 family)
MTAPHPTKQASLRIKPLPAAARWCLLALAVMSLVLGIVGLFLPMLPTVPFLLLAAWAAGHSSPRLSHWLENHPRLGPPISDWRRAGLVSRRAKWAATAAMTASAIASLLVLRAHWAAVAAAAMMACVLAWLWMRPEREAP